MLSLFLSTLFFVLGCAQKPIKDASFKQYNEIAQKVKVDSGPTQKDVRNGFIDRTKKYGLDGVQGVVFNSIDLNKDGYSDLVVLPDYFSQPDFYLYSKKEKKFFKDQTSYFNEPLKASYLLFYDFNRDSVIDVLAGVLNQKSELTKEPLKIFYGKKEPQGIRFYRSHSALKLPAGPASSIAVGDFDLNGYLDIFVANWFNEVNRVKVPTSDDLLLNSEKGFIKSNQLLLSERGKKKNEVYSPNAKPSFAASTCDLDQNGYADILVVSSSGYHNKLWMNLADSVKGGRKFIDYGKQSQFASDSKGSLINTGGGRSFFSSCTDYNNDGPMDVFLAESFHGWDPENVDRSSILTGTKEDFPPYFLRTEYLGEVSQENWNQSDKRAVWIDFNLDGNIDLLVDNSGFPPNSRLIAFEQQGDHSFINMSTQLGLDIVNPTSSIVIDVNQDGKPDILTGQSNVRLKGIQNRVFLFENNIKTNGKAVRFYLSGRQANQQGIGAMVSLYVLVNGTRKIYKRFYELSNGGPSAQHEEGIHFGIPSYGELKGVKVIWPAKNKVNISSKENIEKLYPLNLPRNKKYMTYTLCESGKALPGKQDCF